MSREKLTEITLITPETTRRQFLERSAGLVGALSVGGLLAGAPGALAADAGQATRVKFQLRWLKDIAWAGYYCAIEKGYYRAEGIDLNIVPGGPNIDVQQIVGAGGAQIGLGITDSIIRGRIAGAPLRVIGAQYQRAPAGFITLAKDNIRTPKDLSTKRIATTTNGIPLVNALFEHAGLPSDQWTFVNSGFDPSPLVQGQADAFHGFCTDQGLALTRQGVNVSCLTYDKFKFLGYDGCLVTTDSVIQRNPQLLVGFLRATIKGWEYNLLHRREGAVLTVNKYGLKGLDLPFQAAQNVVQTPFLKSNLTNRKGLFWMNPAVWQATIDFLFGSESIERRIRASEVMTTRFLQQAYAGKTKLL